MSNITSELYFKRQTQLWGESKQRALAKKSIAIIGAGGLGSSLALALGTSGIGRVDMVDFDVVSAHNIHRQIAFTLEDEGRNKAKCISKLLKAKNPFVDTTAFEMDFDTFVQMGNRYDVLLDATDNLATRKAIDTYAKKEAMPWVYASVEEFMGQVCFMNEASFDVITQSDHQPAGIAAPIVMHIASLQANLVLRYLVGLSVKKDTLYYLSFDDEGLLQTQIFGMPK